MLHALMYCSKQMSLALASADHGILLATVLCGANRANASQVQNRGHAREKIQPPGGLHADGIELPHHAWGLAQSKL